jgi:hypothetical protein
MKHINAQPGQTADLFNVIESGTYSYHLLKSAKQMTMLVLELDIKNSYEREF